MYRAILYILLLLTLSSPVQAVECFSPSPSVKNNIDVYEEIHTRDLTKTEYDELSQLFDEMRGGWTGKAVDVTCRGDEDHPREEKTDFTVEADIDTDMSKAFVLDLNLHSDAKRQSTHEKLSYFLSQKRLGITKASRAGDIELINVAPNFLVYMRKINRRTRAGGSVALEFVKSLAVYDHGLMMEDLRYSNGVLESKRTMSLNRK